LKSFTTERFRRSLESLPPEVRAQARQAYGLFRDNPDHPGLRFKKVHPTQPIFSVRVTRDYRAVGVLKDDSIVWFFIGSHSEYTALLKGL
jgi:hypothetical protein